MFKKTAPNPQLDMFTAPAMQLGDRACKKYSDPNAWHNQFYSLVTTKIDEEIFKPLFPSGKKSGRPNASIRVLVGMSILKEGYGCSDEDLFENPNDPDASYRDKNDRKVQGYVTNITETVEEGKPSIITSVQVETAVFADCHFLQDAVGNSEGVTGSTIEDLYADGAYQSPENREFAKNHDDMQLKTGKMQGGRRWELIPHDEDGLAVREIATGNTYEAAMFQYSFHTRNGKTRYRGLLKHRIHAYSRCMWMNLRRIVIFQISTFQRPIFALYEPLREAFYWLKVAFTNKIRIPVVSYVSIGMSPNDKTKYQNSCKTATF